MNTINGQLIIVEGPDYAGKTKLCNYLIETYRFNYWHHGVYQDVQQAHSECLDTILANIKDYNSNWIIDRLHVSEEVYGNIFRSKSAYDYIKCNQNIQERFAKYQLIFCLPPKDIVLEGFAKRRALGNEHFDTVEKVYDAYNNIYNDNLKTNKLGFIYKHDFTIDPDYIKLKAFLERSE